MQPEMRGAPSQHPQTLDQHHVLPPRPLQVWCLDLALPSLSPTRTSNKRARKSRYAASLCLSLSRTNVMSKEYRCDRPVAHGD
jgi:hypothetical protein